MTHPSSLILSGWLSLAIVAGAIPTGAQTASTRIYQCAANQTLAVTVLPLTQGQPEQIKLTLPDQSALTLPRVVSASGAKYSNGTFTFWSKGNTAFVEQGDTIVLKDCVTIPE